MIRRGERIVMQRDRNAENHNEEREHIHSHVGLIGRLLHLHITILSRRKSHY